MPGFTSLVARAARRAARRRRDRGSSRVVHLVTRGPRQQRFLEETLASLEQQGLRSETLVVPWGPGTEHDNLAEARNYGLAAASGTHARLIEAGDTFLAGSTRALLDAADGTVVSVAGRSAPAAGRGGGWRDRAFAAPAGLDPGLADRLIDLSLWRSAGLEVPLDHGRWAGAAAARLDALGSRLLDVVVHEDHDRALALPFGHARRWADEVDAWCDSVELAAELLPATRRVAHASAVLDRRLPQVLQDVESFSDAQWDKVTRLTDRLRGAADPDSVRVESRVLSWATASGSRDLVTELVLSRWREPADLPTVVEGDRVTTTWASRAVPAEVRRLGPRETPLVIVPRRRDASVLEVVVFVRGVETEGPPDVTVSQGGRVLRSELVSTPTATRVAAEAEHAHDHAWLRVDLDGVADGAVHVDYTYRGIRRSADHSLPDELDVRLPPDPRGDDEIGPWAQRHLQRWYAEPRPVQADLAYFQSYTGHQPTDSPLAIFHAARRLRPDLTFRWMVDGLDVPVPAGAEPVLARSRDWYETLSTARYLVTNIEMERWFRRRDPQVLVQTFHGNPGKTMGLAAWERAGLTPGRVQLQLEHGPGNWSLLVSPSPEMTVHYREQFLYDGRVEDHGYPRDDVLVGDGVPERREAARRALGIGPDQTVVLYAPTWRDEFATNYRRARLHDGFDVVAAAAGLGEGFTLLLRGHRFHKTAARPRGARVLDVTAWPEVNELILAADAAVLDYSSLRFDFALTDRPMVFCVPDLEAYTTGRGFLYDFTISAPGPLVRSTPEVVTALADVERLRAQTQHARDAFNARFNGHQDGRSAERVARTMLGL